MPSINTRLSQHDYDQLVLLAKLNHTSPAGIARRMIQAYLDGRETAPEAAHPPAPSSVPRRTAAR